MIKILFVSADPKEKSPLNLDLEYSRIESVLKSSQYRNEFKLKPLLATTYKKLREELIDWKPSFIHFCGHGMGKDGLEFVNSLGEKDFVNSQALADLFRICQNENRNIVCITFNTCHGEFQSKDIREYIKYSIGMSQEIKDIHAINFAEAFYDAIFSKTTIETAFELGRNSILKSININSQSRATFDPADDDYIVISKNIPDYDIPQLIVNKSLENLYFTQPKLIKEEEKKEILSYQQWKNFYSILEKIKSRIIKNVLQDTLKKDLNIQDVESIITSLKTEQDLKKILFNQYPNKNIILILYFANRLKLNNKTPDFQQLAIKKWLEPILKNEHIKLPEIFDTKEIQSSEILNYHLLICIMENTGLGDNFTLKSELVANDRESENIKTAIPITFDPQGINEISCNVIKPYYIIEFISQAINCHDVREDNLTVELFVPFGLVADDFDLYEI